MRIYRKLKQLRIIKRNIIKPKPKQGLTKQGLTKQGLTKQGLTKRRLVISQRMRQCKQLSRNDTFNQWFMNHLIFKIL